MMSGIKTRCAAVLVALAACSALTGCDSGEMESEWGDSSEFSQLVTGQTRFSDHETGIDSWHVIVDHQTGIQYLAYDYYKGGAAVCPLLDVDGTPLRVLEAGDE